MTNRTGARSRITCCRAVLLGLLLALALSQNRTLPAQQTPAPRPDGQPGQSPTLARSLPAGATGFAEFAGLGSVLARLHQSSYLAMVTGSPQFQALERTPQYNKADAVRKIVEAQLGADLWQVAEQLLGDRIAVGVYPKDGGNPAGNLVVLLQGAHPETLLQVRQRVEPFLVIADAQAETNEAISGAKRYSIGGQAFLAWGDSWVAAASTRELLNKTLGLMAGKEQGALAEEDAFRAMTAQMGSEHAGLAFVNLAQLTKAKGSRLPPEKLDNPVVSMLVGGIVELAAGSPYAGLALDIAENRFLLTSGIAGDSRNLDEAHRVFFSDPAGPGTPDIPQLPSLIGGFTFHLDLANWYRQREKLLEARILPGFDQFESGIANLLPGKDVGEDVVPLIGKNITFVAAPQDYAHLDGQPGVKLPGFGLIVELARPEEGGDLFQLFFQTLSAILNLQAGQQNRQPWVMQSELYKDVLISYGRYLKKPAGDQLPLVFNFMPASARVGNRFIISSSLGTCRHLIDRLHEPFAAAPRPNRNLNFEFHPAALADLLQLNRQVFQARALQQGSEPKQAEAEFAALLEFIRSFDFVRLSTQVLPEAFQVQFEGSWK